MSKAITLWQPWAQCVAVGLKRYETRSWSTKYRGKLLIHAAKRKVDPQGMINFQRAMGNDSDLVPELVNLFDGWFNEDFPRGCVVAIADLNNCQEMYHEKWAKIYGITDQIKNKANHPKILIEDQTSQERCLGNWLQGRYAWKLENIQSVRPIPAKGKQGLWIPSAELIQKVEEAITP